jgi:hypothetical protein
MRIFPFNGKIRVVVTGYFNIVDNGKIRVVVIGYFNIVDNGKIRVVVTGYFNIVDNVKIRVVVAGILFHLFVYSLEASTSFISHKYTI